MRKSYLILPLLCMLLFSCQDVVECIVNRRPTLSNKTLSEGSINSYYKEVIHAQVKNETQDDSYWYYFDVSGDIPNGLNVYVNYRTVTIEGYPQEAGDFFVNVNLQVEQNDNYYCDNDWNDCDGLCDDRVSKQYPIIIN